MSITRPLAVLSALAGLALCPLSHAGEAPGLAPAEFRKLHEQLVAAHEPWEAIPWRLSLLEAQAAAARDKKPIYLLVRSGHPLGCV
jgi:hypothetical protein